MSGDTVVTLSPCTDILETLLLSFVDFIFLILIYFGCRYSICISFKLADAIDINSVSGIYASSVSVLEEDLDFSNEVAISFSGSLLIDFSSFVCGDFCWSDFKLPITSLTMYYVVGMNGLLERMILCLNFFNCFNIKQM